LAKKTITHISNEKLKVKIFDGRAKNIKYWRII